MTGRRSSMELKGEAIAPPCWESWAPARQDSLSVDWSSCNSKFSRSIESVYALAGASLDSKASNRTTSFSSSRPLAIGASFADDSNWGSPCSSFKSSRWKTSVVSCEDGLSWGYPSSTSRSTFGMNSMASSTCRKCWWEDNSISRSQMFYGNIHTLWQSNIDESKPRQSQVTPTIMEPKRHHEWNNEHFHESLSQHLNVMVQWVAQKLQEGLQEFQDIIRSDAQQNRDQIDRTEAFHRPEPTTRKSRFSSPEKTN